MSFARFVALGDSFSEGLDDLRIDGTPRGWADLVAGALAAQRPGLEYANLAVRSLRIDEIVDRQVPLAVGMRPDLVAIAGGGNDILGLRVDVAAVAARLDEAVATLRATGATTIMFTGFDPRGLLPFARLLAGRTAAYNEALRETARRYGALVVDLWSMPELRDPRLWSDDRLHLSATGHRHIAAAVLDLLDVTAPAAWRAPTDAPPVPRPWVATRAAEVAWWQAHFVPWAVRKLRGRSMGDGRDAKRPVLAAWADDLADAGR